MYDYQCCPDSAQTEENSMRKQNAALIIAIAFVLAAPSVALAYKKKASSGHFHISHSETNWSLIQHQSNSRILQPGLAEWREDREAVGHGTVGKSAGFK
jgi:hypothetical protein